MAGFVLLEHAIDAALDNKFLTYNLKKTKENANRTSDFHQLIFYTSSQGYPAVIGQEAGLTQHRSPVHHRATQRQTATLSHSWGHFRAGMSKVGPPGQIASYSLEDTKT